MVLVVGREDGRGTSELLEKGTTSEKSSSVLVPSKGWLTSSEVYLVETGGRSVTKPKIFANRLQEAGKAGQRG